MTYYQKDIHEAVNKSSVDKIFVINHPKLIDRLYFQKKQFDKFKLKYKIINSIKCNHFTNFYNKNIKSLFLTHLEILKSIIDIDELCLILEDDAEIYDIDEVNKYIDYILKNNLSLNWDMIYFDKPVYFNKESQNAKLISETKLVDNYIYKPEWQLQTHAYIMNPKIIKDVVQILINHIDNIENGTIRKDQGWPRSIKRLSHIDQVYKDYLHPKLNIYTPIINLIGQCENFESTLNYKKDSSCRLTKDE